jgi:hypothetical protein
MYTAIFSEYAVEAWLSSRKKKKLISLITNKLWSFFATLRHLYIRKEFCSGVYIHRIRILKNTGKEVY